MQPTPWQMGKDQPAQGITPAEPSRSTRRRRFGTIRPPLPLRLNSTHLHGNWGYLCAGIGGIVTFFALFQPWLNATATDGRIKATPFGKFEISSSLVALWSDSPPPAAKINGTWAVLACMAIIVTVIVVVLNLRTRTRALSSLVVASSIAMSLFVVFALVHMNRQAPSVRNMVGNGPAREPGSVVGLVIRWASGNSTYAMPGVRRYTWATAGLTSWAWFAGAIAVLSAMAAIGQWARNRQTDPGRESVRVSLVKLRAASKPSATA